MVTLPFKSNSKVRDGSIEGDNKLSAGAEVYEM